jgi:ABC-2 type transport system ATP-binding protein
MSFGKDRFIFLTTHYLEEAEQLADKIGILKDGKLISIGTLPELRSSTRYQYSIKLPPNVHVPQLKDGELTVSASGYTQIMTNEDEAFSLAKTFAEQAVKFSIAPVTLDDIFFNLVGQKARDE